MNLDEAKEIMVKFRYNLNRFNNDMNDYEDLVANTGKARSNQQQQKLHGLTTISDEKWATFITDLEQKAEAKFNSAGEAFQAVWEIFQAKKSKKAKT